MPQPERLGVAEHVEQLRSSILSKTDAIQELRSRLQTTCVPLSICTYLSQCIKDTDVCIADALFPVYRDTEKNVSYLHEGGYVVPIFARWSQSGGCCCEQESLEPGVKE